MIEQLRHQILSANAGLSENIKWNGPNYCFEGEDRITMKIHPPKQIQLIFHRGAKALEQPDQRLIGDAPGFLAWKANDRAVASFKSLEDISVHSPALTRVVNEWLEATQ